MTCELNLSQKNTSTLQLLSFMFPCFLLFIYNQKINFEFKKHQSSEYGKKCIFFPNVFFHAKTFFLHKTFSHFFAKIKDTQKSFFFPVGKILFYSLPFSSFFSKFNFKTHFLYNKIKR